MGFKRACAFSYIPEIQKHQHFLILRKFKVCGGKDHMRGNDRCILHSGVTLFTGICEIMINGPDRIFIEKDGQLKKSNISFSSKEKLYDVIQQIVALNNRVVNESGRQWTGDFSPVHF